MSHAWPSLPLAMQPRGVDAPTNSSSMRMGCWIPGSALEFVLRRTHKAPHAQTPPLDPRRCQNPPHTRGTQDRQSHRPNLKTHGSRCALQSTHQANQTRDEVDASIAHHLDAIQHRLRFSTPTNTLVSAARARMRHSHLMRRHTATRPGRPGRGKIRNGTIRRLLSGRALFRAAKSGRRRRPPRT